MKKTTTEPTTQPGSAGHTTVSGRPIKALYTADDIAEVPAPEAPGQFPYTRGIHASGYAGKLWTMRQFSGFGTPEQTNQRYKDLLAAGGTGLSVAFDLPTLMGRDPDHPLALGEVGNDNITAVDALAAALEDPNDFVKSEAAVALGRLKDSRAVPALLKAAGTENPFVQLDMVIA
ncbi:MAG: methylmalonyl-CoA mutase family protein, partial [Vicinamibacterales bacterium]|nr:methylmalonyl-CoA mutase family protein [Vicinamibacterales bacterium]